MAAPARKANWQNDDPAAAFIPYSAHITDSIISLEGGAVMAMFAVDGVAHQSAADDDLDSLHEALNALWRNIAAPDVAVWSHIIRSKISEYPGGEQPPGSFAEQADNKYREMIAKKTMLGNRLFLSILVKPPRGGRWFSSNVADDLDKRVKRLTDILRIVDTSLRVYRARRLALYEHDERLYSEPLEVLSYLINGKWQKVLAPRARISDTLCKSRLIFHKETTEVRRFADVEYQASIGIKEYPEQSETGLLNILLTQPCELVISQSFAMLSRSAAINMMQKNRRRMVNAGDLSETQIDEIDEALDDLASGRIIMGDHQLTVTVKSNDPNKLDDLLAETWASVQDAVPGAALAREDLALEAAFWAQLPGNFKYRPRPSPITSRNFVGFSSLHNYPVGRRSGNQWGPAVMMFRTVSGAPYYFNFHQRIDRASYDEDGDEDEGSSQRVPGNTLVMGPTGSGKTVTIGMAIALAEKFDGPRVIFDKNRGLEILIRALGGVYLPLQNGQPTGFNPFKVAETDGYRQFLYRLTKKLVSDSMELTLEAERELVQAIDRVMDELPHEYRRLTAVKQTITNNRLVTALDKWTQGGEYGWAFDNEDDELDFTQGRLFGFDVTEFLKAPELRTPIVMYLLERMDTLIQGGRFICMMDEFATLLRDPEFDRPIQDKLETIRKMNGLMLLACQSPTQVAESPIASSVIEQCVTLIFFPNPKANRQHLEMFGLTSREIEIVTNNDDMPEGSRRMLIKQGNESVIASLDLEGFSDELAVISGTAENVAVMEAARRETGNNWLPTFFEKRV